MAWAGGILTVLYTANTVAVTATSMSIRLTAINTCGLTTKIIYGRL